MGVRRVVAGVGRALITIGVLILLFVAYQLWGTGISEARDEHRLKNQFKTLQQAPPPPATPGVALPPTPEGDAVAIIEIPKINVSKAVVQGVGVEDLKKGPGHYPQTPMPGQKGNAAIAGHRTTYGAPFGSIDELQPDDEITVTTVQGKFTYKVMRQADGSGHVIFNPDHVEVLSEIPGKNT